VVKGIADFHKFILIVFTTFLYVVLISSCSVQDKVVNTEMSSSEFRASRDRVVATARKELGDSYKFAASGPERWDCSGLTHHSYSKAGINIERSSNGISKMVGGIELKDAKKGDLIFYKKDGRVFHVSIITEHSEDNLWVVHSTTSRGVIEEDILKSPYWEKKIYKVISLVALSDVK
jgi:probable lipoprotein NlpC